MRSRPPLRPSACAWCACLLAGCVAACRSGAPAETPAVVTFPGSALGAEGAVLRRQLGRFMAENPDIRVEQRPTPDAADQRHQLYVQWLNAGVSDPDILQLDVIWTPEFAAAGWILPLDRYGPDTAAFFPATLAANRWRDTLFALPWFADVGMLYWRTDLLGAAPADFESLRTEAMRAVRSGRARDGLIWQGARYEGLVTTFIEYLGGFGGRVLDGGHVALNSAAGRRALQEMVDEIHRDGIVPPAVLTWQEEQTRLAFQRGTAAFMRNWPYAAGLMQDSANSRVAGRFGVALMPAAPGGTRTAALGGSQLAINRHSDHPDAAWRVIRYLTAPEQMRERALTTGQFPPRWRLYEGAALEGGLAVPPAEARRLIEHAVPRPVTPVYTQLSQLLQVHLHRALTRQERVETALEHAAAEMQRVLDRAGLGPAPRATRR